MRVVAAGKVPRASGDRVKTDKRDAERLARLLAAGEFALRVRADGWPMRVPGRDQAIEDCRGDLMRGRHRLGKFLLRRDVRWPGPGSTWTQKHMSWLRSLRLEDPCSRATFIDYLSAVEMLLARRAALLAAALRAGHPGQPPRQLGSRRCGASRVSTRSRPPDCAFQGRRLAPVRAQATVWVSRDRSQRTHL